MAKPAAKIAHDTGPSAEGVAADLAFLLRARRREEARSGWASIGVGVLLVVVVWFAVFGYGLGFVRRFNYAWISGGATFDWMRVGLAIAWFVVALVWAWGHVQPLAAPQPLAGNRHDAYLDPPPTRLDRPEPNWSGLESVFAALASGPRQILEGVATFRDAPRADERTLLEASKLLRIAAAADGLRAKDLPRDEAHARAMGILWRLKLIRKDAAQRADWIIRATERGSAPFKRT